jgi:hypothetical protein
MGEPHRQVFQGARHVYGRVSRPQGTQLACHIERGRHERDRRPKHVLGYTHDAREVGSHTNIESRILRGLDSRSKSTMCTA